MFDRKYILYALNAVSGAAMVAGAAWLSYNLFAARDAETPVRVVNSITVDPSILLVGRPFTAYINVTLTRLCPYEVHWSLIRKADGVEVLKTVEQIKPAPAAVGTQDLPPSIRYVPPSVAPGEYRYVSDIIDLCPDGHAFTAARKGVDIFIR